MSRSIVGLEIVEHAVRGVEVVKSDSKHPKVRSFAEVALPAGSANDSEVLERGAVADALSRLWREGGFKSKRVVLGVGNRRILVRDYVAPMLPLDEIKQALAFQVQDVLPVPIDQAVLDFYPLRPTTAADGSDGVGGLLVCAVDENIDQLLLTLAAARLEVVGVDLAPFGLARAASRVSDPNQRTLVVHIGESTSYFVVLHAGVPQFVRIVPAGIAVDLLAPLTADVLPNGFSGGPAVTPIDDFLTWFGSTRDFYARAHADAPIDTVLLCGGGAADPAVADRIAGLAGVDVGLLRLSAVFDLPGGRPSTRDDVANLAVAGFAVGWQ